MARIALIRKSDGLVVNVIVCDNDYVPPIDHILVDAELSGGTGDTWNGTVFVAPSPVPPIDPLKSWKDELAAAILVSSKVAVLARYLKLA